MISFIICFHSSRRANLEQTLRFLWNREPTLRNAEVVLVAHDEDPDVTTSFDTTRINLHLDTYRRPYMLNVGVKNCKYDKIVLLDSDRVLPPYYFTSALGRLRPKMAITIRKLYTLIHDYTDGEINSGRVRKYPDFRRGPLRFGRKNLFSGNTLMYKKDYLDAGGMDEDFYGYGFADNDMTMTVERLGYKILYLPGDEYHLRHPPTYIQNGATVNQNERKALMAVNVLKFCFKWRIKPTQYNLRFVREARYLPGTTEETRCNLDIQVKRFPNLFRSLL